jgi:hypothetical protein
MRAWGTSASDTIDELPDRFLNQPTTPVAPLTNPTSIPVQALYEGTLITGEFDATSGRMTITSGPLRGQHFKSPSGAAMAVVRALNPSVHPNRNGWTFWTVSDTGQVLESMRRKTNRPTS